MRDPLSYFRLISNTTIVVNLLVGLAAIFLVERLVPAIDEILQENAYSIEASMAMQVSIATGDAEQFWQAVTNAENNITIDEEKPIVATIKRLGDAYWGGNDTVKSGLIEESVALSAVNLHAMKQRDDEARYLGLGGAWALGFLVIISMATQMVAHRRVVGRLMAPISELIAVLVDYRNGNTLRRFRQPDAADEVRLGGDLLNVILDRDMAR